MNRRGMVMVEFVFVVGPLLVFILCLAQAMMLQVGKLATIRASHAAVRAAVVVLDDDPRHYGGAARGDGSQGSPRHDAIRRAAAGVLLAVVPPHRQWGGPITVGDTISAPGAGEQLPGLLTPNQSLLDAVTVELAGGGQVGRRDLVTVELSFEFPCTIPVGRRVLCSGGARTLTAASTLPNHGASYDYQ